MLNLVRFWILLSTLLVSGGWILSALHQLNRAGYAVILLLMLPVIFVWWKKSCPLSRDHLRRWQGKFRKRFRRRAPQFFLLIAGIALLSGSLYPALNLDANAYRLPRIMHWLWAGQWHWITAFDARMNIAACGMEWLSAPLILFSHSDRLLFLINWLSYLMLPGLIFSVFTRLQVRPRVAWWWAWLLSSGLCFAMQAGSAGNDSFAAIYILAAVDLALRAREKNSSNDLWLSLLAAALTTGAKQTDIPLAALWLIAAWPALPLFWKKPLQTAMVAGFGLLVSIVPVSIANYCHCGTWMPLNSTDMAVIGQFQLNPFWGVIGNTFCLAAQNLLPPFYQLLPPLYSFWVYPWNDLMHAFVHTSFGAHFSSFEKFGFLSGEYYHGISECNAGLGFGICVMVFATIKRMRQLKPGTGCAGEINPDRHLRWLRLAPWGLLVLFMAKVGTYDNARHLAPYYLFLFPIWLVKAGHGSIIRQAQWQQLGLFFMAITAALVATTSDRPLFPAHAIWSSLQAKFPNVEIVTDQSERYLKSPYQGIQSSRDFIKRVLPKDEKVVGYYSRNLDAHEPGIWLPYGQRRVELVYPDESLERLRALGVHYILVEGYSVRGRHGTVQNWIEPYNAACVETYPSPSESKPNTPPSLYLIRLN